MDSTGTGKTITLSVLSVLLDDTHSTSFGDRTFKPKRVQTEGSKQPTRVDSKVRGPVRSKAFCKHLRGGLATVIILSGGFVSDRLRAHR